MSRADILATVLLKRVHRHDEHSRCLLHTPVLHEGCTSCAASADAMLVNACWLCTAHCLVLEKQPGLRSVPLFVPTMQQAPSDRCAGVAK